LTLNLRDDEELIALYEHYHRPGGVWPEVLESIRDSGILNMTIYRSGVLLVMIMDVDETFSFERKAALDRDFAKVQAWEKEMERFQEVVTGTGSGKWKLMKAIFQSPVD
jgi:L-rhamnose mutarotase